MIEKTIIVKPSLDELLEITKGFDNPISMESLRRETGDRFRTKIENFSDRSEYWHPTKTILQRAIIIADTVGQILVTDLRRDGSKGTIMVTGAGKKKFTDILDEKTEGCEIINQGDDTTFTLTQETPESPIYAFEGQLIVTKQGWIQSKKKRETYWRTPRSILQDQGTNLMEKNMIRYLVKKEGLEV